MNLLNQLGERLSRIGGRSVEDRALLERLARLNDRNGFTLCHALQIAAERFDADAATMLEQKRASEAILEADPTARLMFYPAACDRLADQFRRQAADARGLVALIEGDDEEEESEAA
jgi:hypothetical protein